MTLACLLVFTQDTIPSDSLFARVSFIRNQTKKIFIKESFHPSQTRHMPSHPCASKFLRWSLSRGIWGRGWVMPFWLRASWMDHRGGPTLHSMQGNKQTAMNKRFLGKSASTLILDSPGLRNKFLFMISTIVMCYSTYNGRSMSTLHMRAWTCVYTPQTYIHTLSLQEH